MTLRDKYHEELVIDLLKADIERAEEAGARRCEIGDSDDFPITAVDTKAVRVE